MREHTNFGNRTVGVVLAVHHRQLAEHRVAEGYEAMWSLREARNRFSTVVNAALDGTPQEVTRRGKPAVVVISASEYDRLLAQAQATGGSFVDHLLAFPGAVDRARVTARPVRL